MNNSYPVFTVSSGTVLPGASISLLHLKGAGIDIPAVMVGEEGRGRERGVVPVGNPPMVPCPERGKEVYAGTDNCRQCGIALGEKHASGFTRAHPDEGETQGRLSFAEVGETKSGKPKFFSKDRATDNDFAIVVIATKIGYRGSNAHSGDRTGWKCVRHGCDASGEGPFSTPTKCPECDGEG
ncbi:MAG TPA: hypothetical protein VN495_04420, partial [Candidatus Paceibacterota bacterium]|nr:hypothetical protein [Candidatus Paceibacterota bacterium]